MANLDELIAIANSARGVGAEDEVSGPAEPTSDPMAALEALRATTIEPDPAASLGSSASDYLGAGVTGIGQGLKSTFWDAPASILSYLGNLPGRMKEEIPPGASLSSMPILGPVADAGQIMAHDFGAISPEQRVGIAAQGALGAVAPAAGLVGKLGLGAGSGIINAIMGHDEGEGPTSMVQDFTSGATSLLAPLAVAGVANKIGNSTIARKIGKGKDFLAEEGSQASGAYAGKLGADAERTNIARGAASRAIDAENDALITKEAIASNTPPSGNLVKDWEQYAFNYNSRLGELVDVKDALNQRIDDLVPRSVTTKTNVLGKAKTIEKGGRIDFPEDFAKKLQKGLGDDVIVDPITEKPFTVYQETGLPYLESTRLLTGIYDKLEDLKAYSAGKIGAAPLDPATLGKVTDQVRVLKSAAASLRAKLGDFSKKIISSNPDDAVLNEILSRPVLKNHPNDAPVRMAAGDIEGLAPAERLAAQGVLPSDRGSALDNIYRRYSALKSIDYYVNEKMPHEIVGGGATRSNNSLLGERIPGNALTNPRGSILGALWDKAVNKFTGDDSFRLGGKAVAGLRDVEGYRLGTKPQPVLRDFSGITNFLNRYAPHLGSAGVISQFGNGEGLLNSAPVVSQPPPLRVEPDSKSVNENKDKIIEDLSMKLGPDAPQVISQLQPALDSKDPDQLGATMAALIHAYPEVRPMFSDDPTKPYVTFNKKVYTPQDRQMVAKLIEDSNKSVLQKAKAMRALNKNGTILV